MTEMKNNIRQRPNGTWEGRYYDVDGKQHSLYGRTKAIVKDKLASKRAEIVSGNSITETDLTSNGAGSGCRHSKSGKSSTQQWTTTKVTFAFMSSPISGM